MSDFFNQSDRCREVVHDGYRETIQRGLAVVRSFRGGLSYGQGSQRERIGRLQEVLEQADVVVVGAGAGLSTSAGMTYSGERFDRYFADFSARFGIQDMYSGGFYPFPDDETRWAWWARHIYVNRYVDAPRPVYQRLLQLLDDKDHFVITTNVDHLFQKAGFDKGRLFYTQGDYGLFQSVDPANKKTYDNEGWVMRAMEAQGFVKDADGIYQIPGSGVFMRIPSDLIPKCLDDGSDVTTNLRADDSFVEDEGWHQAAERYSEFLRRHENLKVLFLEAAVGMNTPSIIKFQFWKIVNQWPDATYACLNYGEAYAPDEIINRSICINGDIREILMKL
jgi:NAD-dependent SIR2 family protein deacetylase